MVLLTYLGEAALSLCAYGLVGCGWWRTLRRRRDLAGGDSDFTLLLALTLMWAQIFFVVLVLGLAGVLYGYLVLGINAGITGALLWMTRRPLPAREQRLRKPHDVLLRALAAVGAITFLWFAVLNIFYPTGGYDDYVFHVPAAANFVQHHAIRIFDVTRAQDGINSAAKIGELFSVWQYFVTRNDRMIGFWELGMLAQYLVAVYGLCRELGCTARAGLFGALLSAFAPVLLFQTLTASNDLSTCAFFATALRFAVARSRGWLQRIAVGISSGLLFSSKLSAGLLCGIAFVGFWLAEAAGARRPVFAGKSMAVMGSITVLLGGFWYVRNFQVYGNPFYPFEVRIAGFHLPAPLSNTHEMSLLNPEYSTLPLAVRLWRLWREEKSHFGLWLYNNDSAYAGFGPICFVLGAPSLALACVLTLLDRHWLAASVLFMIVAAYLGFAGNISPRLSLFILPAVGLGIALTLTAVDKSCSPYAAGIRLLGLSLASYTFLAAAMSPLNPVSIRNQLFVSPHEKDQVGGSLLAGFANVRTATPRNAIVAYDESSTFIWPLWRTDWNNQVHYIATSGGWEAWRRKAAALGVTNVVVGSTRNSTLNELIHLHHEHFLLIAEGWSGALYAYR